MKGNPQFVMCGNSERALHALRAAGAPVTAVDVLPDPEIRQELSALSAGRRSRRSSSAASSSAAPTSCRSSREPDELEQKLSESLGDGYREDAEERVVSVLVPA
jgi:hypothetical protein